jgi:hypothetical protein
MLSTFRTLWFATFTLAAAVVFPVPAQGQSTGESARRSRPLITQDIHETQLVRLAGNTRPEVTVDNDRGVVSDALPVGHLLLQLQRSS